MFKACCHSLALAYSFYRGVYYCQLGLNATKRCELLIALSEVASEANLLSFNKISHPKPGASMLNQEQKIFFPKTLEYHYSVVICLKVSDALAQREIIAMLRYFKYVLQNGHLLQPLYALQI